MPRRAFTLLEILLTLAILLVVAGLAAFSLSGMLRTQRLSQSADLVRGDWARARSKAMKTGAIQIFRYEVGGARYSIDSWMSEGAELEASAELTERGDSAAVGSRGETDAARSGPALLEGVSFFASETAETARDAQVEDEMQGSDQLEGKPLLFYPDGSTSDARVILATERQEYIVLTLRGLTGVSQSSGLLAAEELSP